MILNVKYESNMISDLKWKFIFSNMCTSFYFVNGTPYITIRGVGLDRKVGGTLNEGTWKWGQALLEDWKENIAPLSPQFWKCVFFLVHICLGLTHCPSRIPCHWQWKRELVVFSLHIWYNYLQSLYHKKALFIKQ